MHITDGKTINFNDIDLKTVSYVRVKKIVAGDYVGYQLVALPQNCSRELVVSGSFSKKMDVVLSLLAQLTKKASKLKFVKNDNLGIFNLTKAESAKIKPKGVFSKKYVIELTYANGIVGISKPETLDVIRNKYKVFEEEKQRQSQLNAEREA